MTETRSSTSPDDLARTLRRGAVGGMVAAAVMAMFAMVASVTYQHHGFFTPLFHIAAVAGSSSALMASMQQAMAGNRFWFAPGAALVGLAIHMMTGAAFGMMFAAIARVLPRRWWLAAGAIFGLAVFAGAAYIDLPAAASITGSGDVIANMASMVGWTTFALEHVMFGITLAVYLLTTTPKTAHAPGPATGRQSPVAA
jgi:hypothetical protein